MTERDPDQLRVLGATLAGFASACVDLNIVAGTNAAVVSNLDINAWYPFERLRAIEALVLDSYEDVGPILERVGIEMMTSWYRMGPGKALVRSGVDFLRFQSGSQGYASVVQGPEELVGAFALISLDERAKTACIRSTTPFNKHVERGVIIGGMSAPGDLDFIDVSNGPDERIFRIEF